MIYRRFFYSSDCLALFRENRDKALTCAEAALNATDPRDSQAIGYLAATYGHRALKFRAQYLGALAIESIELGNAVELIRGYAIVAAHQARAIAD